MKCEAIGCDRDSYADRLCESCLGLRSIALRTCLEVWDREHRKPKEIVIEVEVPEAWFQSLFPNQGIDASTKEAGNCKWLMFIHPPGRLVLKARKEP